MAGLVDVFKHLQTLLVCRESSGAIAAHAPGMCAAASVLLPAAGLLGASVAALCLSAYQRSCEAMQFPCSLRSDP